MHMFYVHVREHPHLKYNTIIGDRPVKITTRMTYSVSCGVFLLGILFVLIKFRIIAPRKI